MDAAYRETQQSAQSINVCVSINNQLPYKKVLTFNLKGKPCQITFFVENLLRIEIKSYMLCFLFENSNSLYVVNMATQK
jgi:hypothetical protein